MEKRDNPIYIVEIKNTAARLIKAMIEEKDAMPKSFQAPNTVDLAGILRSQLEEIGYEFDVKKVNKKRKSKETK